MVASKVRLLGRYSDPSKHWGIRGGGAPRHQRAAARAVGFATSFVRRPATIGRQRFDSCSGPPGRGRRGGAYGSLLLAAYDDKDNVFRTVTKVGTGFSDAELANLPKRLGPYALDHRHPRVDAKMAADVWFVPAVVLEIVGAEVTLSPIHTAGLWRFRPGSGLAIRFPRFTGRWRDDKGPEDATTVDELAEMYQARL